MSFKIYSANDLDKLRQLMSACPHLTATLNISVNLEYPQDFFQIKIPTNAEMNETGIKTGKMNFHKSCSNISTLSKVIRSIPKKDLNIFTDHGK